jgi:hypothetical protein
MNRKIFLLPVLSVLFILSSCESDQVTATNPSLEKKLLLSPLRLEGEQYKGYEFKAKVTNVPLSDVTFFWDFDDGEGFQEISLVPLQSLWRGFGTPRIYNIRVKAYDYFTDSLLGYDSIRADIRPPAQSFEIIPRGFDTVLKMNSDGTMLEYLVFNIKASIPSEYVTVEWDYGDGSNPKPDYYHYYLHTGTFTVRATAHDKTTGSYLGSDSIIVTIRMPEITSDDLISSKEVDVWLAIDSSVPMAKDSLFSNPFAVGLLINTSPPSYFDAHSFSIVYTDVALGARLVRDTIAGEFSDDLQSLRKVSVSVNDTGRLTTLDRGKLQYSFTLKDLDLLAVTPTTIVYRSVSTLISDFTKDITFTPSGVINQPRGSLTDSFVGRNPPEGKTDAPFALVIFKR